MEDESITFSGRRTRPVYSHEDKPLTTNNEPERAADGDDARPQLRDAPSPSVSVTRSDRLPPGLTFVEVKREAIRAIRRLLQGAPVGWLDAREEMLLGLFLGLASAPPDLPEGAVGTGTPAHE